MTTFKAKFVVEIEATKRFQIGFAAGDIQKRLREVPPDLWRVNYSGEKPEVIGIEVRSYNRAHRRKLLKPAIYGEQK